jgi:hypothetical protein
MCRRDRSRIAIFRRQPFLPRTLRFSLLELSYKLAEGCVNRDAPGGRTR